MLVEGHGRCRVIHLPAGAAVIEVDDLHTLAADQQIGEAQVGMDVDTCCNFAHCNEGACQMIAVVRLGIGL